MKSYPELHLYHGKTVRESLLVPRPLCAAAGGLRLCAIIPSSISHLVNHVKYSLFFLIDAAPSSSAQKNMHGNSAKMTILQPLAVPPKNYQGPNRRQLVRDSILLFQCRPQRRETLFPSHDGWRVRILARGEYGNPLDSFDLLLAGVLDVAVKPFCHFPEHVHGRLAGAVVAKRRMKYP